MARREPWLVTAGSLLLAAAVLGIWQLASARVFVIPQPVAAFQAILAGYEAGEWAAPLRATYGNAAVSFVLAVLAGALVGVLIGRSEYWYTVFDPMLVAGNGVPKIILYPVLLLFFGLGSRSLIAMGFIHGVFPVIINVMAATRNMRPIYAKVGRSLNARPSQMYFKVYLPAISLPLIVSVRLAFSLSIVGVVLGELFAAKEGMGLIIRRSYSLAQYPQMMGAILLLFLTAMLGSLLLWAVERRVRRFAAD